MALSKDAKGELISHWMGEIRRAEEARKKFSTQSSWKDFRSYYRGDWAQGVFAVNRVFSYGRTMIPKVYFHNPRVCVTAVKPEMVFHARVVESIDNWLIKETLLKRTLKRAALIAYLTGTAPIKLGYDSEFGYNPDMGVDRDAGTVTQTAEGEDRFIEYRTNVKPGMPWAIAFQPEDLIIPHGYDDPNSLPWVACRILRPLDDVIQDTKYPKEIRKKLRGTKMTDLYATTERSRPFEIRDGRLTMCEIFEIRDASRQYVYHIAEGKLLLSMPDVLQIDGMPMEHLIFNDDPEYFWGISDVKILEPQQLELNDIRTQAKHHRRVALLKFLYLKDAISKTELEKFLSGTVGPAIEIDGESLANAIISLQPHIPPDLSHAASEVLQDMRESAGFSENELGGFSPYHGKTATETMEVAQAFDSRMNERKDIVGDVMLSIIRKWNQYLFKFWDGERVTEIVGAEGEPMWVQYTADQLRGEYSLKVDLDSGMPVNTTTKMQIADGLLKMYGGDPMVDQIGLKRLHLGQYEWAHPGISYLIRDMDPALSTDLGAERQPSPQMGKAGAGNRPGSNAGGGARGMSPQKPMKFEEAKSKFQGGK